MKTKLFYLVTKATVAVVLLAILAIEALASGTPKVKMVPYGTERALISLMNESNSAYELTIENALGDVVYYKEAKISDEVYSKKFDFRNLREGDYKVTARNNFGTSSTYFSVKGNKLVVSDAVGMNEPFVEIKENVLKLSLLNNSLKDVKLTVSDSYNEVYKKSLGNDFSISAGFNLAGLETGEYAINITDGVKTYSYTFKK
jgi:hypothetical protein